MNEMRISKYDHRDTYVLRIVIAAAALCVFLLMHYLYSSGISMEFDLAVGEAVRSLRSPVMNAVMIPLTNLGNKWTLIGIGIVLIVIDIVKWKKNDYPLAVLACLIDLLIYKILKVLVQRPRPDQIFWLVVETGYSFPSGHSMNGIFCYGMMIYLLQRNCEDKKLRDILTVVLAAIVPLIAFSRVYVGVHHPTDVMAGLAVGLAMLLPSTVILDEILLRLDNKTSDRQTTTEGC